jgi:hypothetical protein
MGQQPLLAAQPAYSQEEEEESDMSPDDDDTSVASSHHSEATSIAALPMDLSLKVGVPTAAAEDLSPLSRLDAGGYFKHSSAVLTEPADDGSRKEPLSDRNSNILRLRNDLEVLKESPMSPNRQDALDLTVSS